MCEVKEFLDFAKTELTKMCGRKVELHLGEHMTEHGETAPVIYVEVEGGPSAPLFIGVTPSLLAQMRQVSPEELGARRAQHSGMGFDLSARRGGEPLN